MSHTSTITVLITIMIYSDYYCYMVILKQKITPHSSILLYKFRQNIYIHPDLVFTCLYANQTMQESNRKALNCQVYNITFIPNHDVKKPFKKNYFYQGEKKMYVCIYRRTYIAHGKSASKETLKKR